MNLEVWPILLEGCEYKLQNPIDRRRYFVILYILFIIAVARAIIDKKMMEMMMNGLIIGV